MAMYNDEIENQFDSDSTRDNTPAAAWDEVFTLRNTISALKNSSQLERSQSQTNIHKTCIEFGQVTPGERTTTPDLPSIGLNVDRVSDRTQFFPPADAAPTNKVDYPGRNGRPSLEPPQQNDKPGDGPRDLADGDQFERPPSGKIGESTWGTQKDVAAELADGKVGEKALNSLKAVFQTLGPEGLKKYVEKINEQLKDKHLKLNAGEVVMMSCFGPPESNGKSHGIHANLVDTNKNETVSSKSTWISGPAANKEQDSKENGTRRGPWLDLPGRTTQDVLDDLKSISPKRRPTPGGS